jgi:4-amino-4-deoxy-L-arabinose transferase-like glycosyltransferase
MEVIEKSTTADQSELTVISGSLVPWLVFLTSAAYLFAFCRYSALEPDEGIILRGAERVLHGQVPYRDFFSFYTPGSYYLVAALFRIFGNSFFVARASIAITGGLCTVLSYVLARRLCSTGIALFAAALTAMASVSYRFLVLHNWYSTLLCCAGLYAAIRLFEARSAGWAFATGVAASLAVLFEQSKGAGLCLGLALGIGMLAWKTDLRLQRREWAAIAAGFVLPVLLTFAYFGSEHASGAMVRDWLWPLRHYATANHVPYGYQNWSAEERHELFHSGSLGAIVIKVVGVSPGLIVPVLPLVAILVFVYLVFKTATPRGDTSFPSYVLVCSVCAGLFLSVIATRADVIHFMYLAPLWYVVLAWTLQYKTRGILRSMQKLWFSYVAFAFFLMGFAMFMHARGATNRVETRRGWIAMSAPDTVLNYVQGHTRPGDRVLVYPYLPLYNYLTATESPVSLDYFQPGMNTPEQGTEILLALQRSPDVLFEPEFSRKIATAWPGTPADAVNSDPMADYIRENYRVCAQLQSPTGWQFEFRVRNESSCP